MRYLDEYGYAYLIPIEIIVHISPFEFVVDMWYYGALLWVVPLPWTLISLLGPL
jgi:hypothetical protein